jgi:hypothetical protein
MHTACGGNSVWLVAEGIEFHLLELFLEVVATLEIINLIFLNALSLLSVGFLLLLIHLKVLILHLFRVYVKIGISLVSIIL